MLIRTQAFRYQVGMHFPGGCKPAATRIAEVAIEVPSEGTKFAFESNSSIEMSAGAMPKPMRCEAEAYLVAKAALNFTPKVGTTYQ